MQNNFVHLRTQSSYSMLESALSISQIISLVKEQSMSAVGLADRGNLFGLLEFSLAALKAQVQPLCGSIVNFAYIENKKTYFSEILLIAKDEIGYRNLLRLVSYTFTENDRKICNHITQDDLISFNEGLIALSCYTEGIVGKFLLSKNHGSAVSSAKFLQNIFGDRFYFEIMRHNLEKEKFIEQSYIDIAYDLNIPLVATNNVLFANINMHDAHDVLMCISAGVTKEHIERKRSSNQCYFKSSKEMIELFHDLPEAIANTHYLAQRCYIMAYAREPMMPSFAEGGNSEEQILRKQARDGLLSRLEIKYNSEQTSLAEQKIMNEQYFFRLDFELNIICRMQFSGYFLIVSDFIKWSKQQGILVGPGRGSGAGSIVAWALLITDLDPIKFGLLFERFLNPERISMPDFDIDFCQERREEVIAYVSQKYGYGKVGQIITFGKMQAKAVIKDVSRVLGLKYDFANYLTDLVPFNAITPVTLNQAINEVAELNAAAKGEGLYNLRGEESLIKQVLSTALILEGLHRHASIHAAGIVIAAKDLMEVVPVYRDVNSSMLVIQYSMKYADIAGLIKFDFLGLQTLTVITKTKDLLNRQNINVDFTTSKFDDEKTYIMLSRGEGTGVFQFEGPGMKDSLRRLKPDNIKDIIALGALYRPGPMENIPTYIACKHGRQKPDYLHPLLESILEETYGVIIYQEQVLEIAKVLSGYTLGSADLLRKAMGKKIKSEMEAQEQIFIKGAVANGIDKSQAKSIFATLAKFAGYGFNKSHASAYAVITYQTAYLKANYPTEFLTACLNLEIDNNDKINVFVQEAKNYQIKILSPNINLCGGKFDIIINQDHSKSILYALGAIKNVTINFGELAKAEVKKNGFFKNIVDFIERMPLKSLNKKALENLIKAGAFEELHPSRSDLLQSVSNLFAYAGSYHQEQSSNQFSLIKVNSVSKNVLVEGGKNEDHAGDATNEFEVLGLFLSKHPILQYAGILKHFGIINSWDLKNNLSPGSSSIKIAGFIQKKDARMSSRGRFITLQLSDQYGIFELTIYSEEVLKEYVHLLDLKTTVIASCDAFKDEGGVKLTARSFMSIDDIIKDNMFNLKLNIENAEDLTKVVYILKNSQSNTSNCEITMCVKINSDFVAKIVMPSFYLNAHDIDNLNNFIVR